MKARLLAAALLLATTAPAPAVTFDWTFTATVTGSAVDLHLSYVMGPPDPGFVLAGFAYGTNVSFFDGLGHEKIVAGDNDLSWTFTYPDAGLYTVRYEFFGWLSEYRACTLTNTCSSVNENRIYHVDVRSQGQAEVLLVPGPAIGAGLPGLMMLLALWRRRRCARSS